MSQLPHLAAIIVVLILTGAGLPVPEEAPIIYAGYRASQGDLYWPMALASCFIGALLGDCVLYGIGYRFGHNLAMKHPRIANLLHAEREQRVEKWLERHGLKVLLVARFMVFLRAPMYLAVGIMRMPMRKFVLVDAVCAAAVVGTFFGLSYKFGKSVEPYIRKSEWLLTIVVVILVAAVLFWTWRRGRSIPQELTEAVDKVCADSEEAAVPAASGGDAPPVPASTDLKSRPNGVIRPPAPEETNDRDRARIKPR